MVVKCVLELRNVKLENKNGSFVSETGMVGGDNSVPQALRRHNFMNIDEPAGTLRKAGKSTHYTTWRRLGECIRHLNIFKLQTCTVKFDYKLTQHNDNAPRTRFTFSR